MEKGRQRRSWVAAKETRVAMTPGPRAPQHGRSVNASCTVRSLTIDQNYCRSDGIRQDEARPFQVAQKQLKVALT